MVLSSSAFVVGVDNIVDESEEAGGDVGEYEDESWVLEDENVEWSIDAAVTDDFTGWKADVYDVEELAEDSMVEVSMDDVEDGDVGEYWMVDVNDWRGRSDADVSLQWPTV